MHLVSSCNTKKSNIIAIVDNQSITMQQVDAVAKDQLFDLLEGIYVIRRNILDEYINRMVITSEAKKEDLSYGEYLDKYVYSTITDSLVDAKIQYLNGIVPDRTEFMLSYDCSTEFGRAYLVESIRRQMVSDLADSLRTKHDIKINLKSPERMRPKVDISGLKLAYKGNVKSSKSVILVGSYACDGCKKALPLFDELYKQYGDKMKFGFCFYEGVPSLASLASKSAEQQDAFWQMHDMLMSAEEPIDSAYIVQCVETLNLDSESFWDAMSSYEIADAVASNIEEIIGMEVVEEPTFLINGRVFNAPFEIETIKSHIERNLK